MHALLRGVRKHAMALNVLQGNMEQGNAVVKDGQTEASATTEKTNKQKKKVIPPTKNELQKLGKDFIVQCDPTTVLLIHAQ